LKVWEIVHGSSGHQSLMFVNHIEKNDRSKKMNKLFFILQRLIEKFNQW